MFFDLSEPSGTFRISQPRKSPSPGQHVIPNMKYLRTTQHFYKHGQYYANALDGALTVSDRSRGRSLKPEVSWDKRGNIDVRLSSSKGLLCCGGADESSKLEDTNRTSGSLQWTTPYYQNRGAVLADKRAPTKWQKSSEPGTTKTTRWLNLFRAQKWQKTVVGLTKSIWTRGNLEKTRTPFNVVVLVILKSGRLVWFETAKQLSCLHLSLAW